MPQGVTAKQGHPIHCKSHETKSIVRSTADGWILRRDFTNNSYTIAHRRTYEESMSIEFNELHGDTKQRTIPMLKRMKVADFNAYCAKRVIIRNR